MFTQRRTVVCAAALLFTMAACSDDDDDSGSAATTAAAADDSGDSSDSGASGDSDSDRGDSGDSGGDSSGGGSDPAIEEFCDLVDELAEEAQAIIDDPTNADATRVAELTTRTHLDRARIGNIGHSRERRASRRVHRRAEQRRHPTSRPVVRGTRGVRMRSGHVGGDAPASPDRAHKGRVQPP